MYNLLNDNKGIMSLFDSLIVIFLIFVVLIAFNVIDNIEIPSLSYENENFKVSQDVMEIMDSKGRGNDFSMIEKISYLMSVNNNSFKSQSEAGKILDEFFDIYLPDKDYSFLEINQLDSKVLSSNGDVFSHENVSVAIRNYGNYSYKLYIA